MTKRLAKALEDLRHDKSKFVFLTDEDEPVGYELHRMWLKWSLKRAGLRQKGSHTLRHLLQSPRDAGRAGASDPAARRSLGAGDD